ncbi:MAG TPA: AAA family ATPase, partial [Candidatus Limnocylindrales bacterium]
MVAGDLVNTASRLQGAAAPGTVLVGEVTQRAASSAIAFEPAGEQTLKGKAAPVPAWRALRVVAERGGRNRTEALEAPFVGRDEELRLLKDLFHATVREGRARLISVIGPAGIGKTRLGWEFSKYRDGLIEPVWFHDGRSPAYGEGISFWALGEMVRERAGLGEGDNEQTTRTSIAATVADHIADDGERRWIEPALLALLGIDAGSVAPDELFAAWRTFFERLAATAPVVMVFEDFHYADSGLIDFVDHLLEWSRAVPIYVVTLARPDFLERRPEWGAGKRSFTSIFLEPLSEAAMGALLAGLVPGLPDAAGRAIIARADGIPLYAVETVRMLLTQGQLALEDGVYRPVGDLTSLAVPDTLTALIASRLDALPADDRALVSDAAVLGQSFTLAGLAAVSGLSEEELQPRLRSLVRREILTLETDARSPERGQFAFVQALVREVAYNTLAKRDRKSRHLAAARFFESLDTDEVAGALAGHYLSAYRNAPEGAEADAVGVQARIALRAAAERAASLGSNDQATSFYEHVLAITTDPMEIAELLESAGEVASAAGRHDAAARHLHQAVEA